MIAAVVILQHTAMISDVRLGKADISALFRKAPAATYRIGLGEQISALGNDSVAGTLDLTELSSQMPARAAMRI